MPVADIVPVFTVGTYQPCIATTTTPEVLFYRKSV